MDVEKALGNLIARQAPDGGWAYFPGQKSRLEPTCLALLALSLAGPRYQSAMKKAWQAIEQAEEEGAYIEKDGRDATIWLTSLVLFVQSALTDDENRIERTAARLLSMRGRIPDEASGELQDIDITLRGWSWAENNFFLGRTDIVGLFGTSPCWFRSKSGSRRRPASSRGSDPR
ncbi:MAG: hypothetical protein KatS3mg105_1738 [Gemmatales bacterium]|nr:MAG: hypothetical protein KatS3mg105_1738 [Gemmatales bacterium]